MKFEARLTIFASWALQLYSKYRIYESMKLDVARMKASAEEAETLLKALANRHRLAILCRLTETESSVGTLAQMLGLRDSTVSQHLALLRKDGLVTPRRDGQTVWYAIASAPARRLLETLYQVYCVPGGVCQPPRTAERGKRK